MAGAWLGALVLAATVLQAAQAVPVPPTTAQRVQETKEQSRIAQVQLDQAELRLQQARDALIKQLIVDVAHDQSIRGAVQAVRVEQQLEDQILSAAHAARGNPQELQKLDQYVRRDKRALGLITGLLGGGGPVNRGPTYSAYIGGGASGFGLGSKVSLLSSLLGSSSGGLGGLSSSSGGSSGGGGSDVDESQGTPPGSDSGSILSLVTPLLGSSSGSLTGGGGGDSEGGSAGAGSDSGSILSLVTPLLGSSSGNGYNDSPSTADSANEAVGESSGASASASAGSDSGSILSLVTPLLGSSSSGGGGGGEGSGDGGGASGGSDSSAILGLVTPLLGSSSGGGGGGGAGDGDSGSSSGGGGSDLSSILGISNSGGGGSVGGGGGNGNLLNEKLKILTDGVGLLLRVKFLLFRKLFGLIGGASG